MYRSTIKYKLRSDSDSETSTRAQKTIKYIFQKKYTEMHTKLYKQEVE